MQNIKTKQKQLYDPTFYNKQVNPEIVKAIDKSDPHYTMDEVFQKGTTMETEKQ